MAYDLNHFVLRFGGRAFTNEQWSSGLRVRYAGVASTLPAMHVIALSTLADVVTAVEGAWKIKDPNVGTTYHYLDFVTWNPVGTDGNQDATLDTVRYDEAAPLEGIHPTDPPQVALCATLRTAVSRGKAHAGRMYWPAPTTTVTAFGRIQADFITSFGTATAQMISDINAIDLGADSLTVSTFSSLGGHHDVTSVAIGDVVDTQRRRRNQLPESYTGFAIP